MKINWKYRITFFVVIIIIYKIIKNFSPTRYERDFKDYQDLYLSNVVCNKYEDKKNHNFKTLQMCDGEKVYLVNENSGLYEFIQIGDSIEKRKGSMEVLLTREGLDTILTIEIMPDSK